MQYNFRVSENYRAQIYWPLLKEFANNLSIVLENIWIQPNDREQILSNILEIVAYEIDSFILPSFVSDFEKYLKKPSLHSVGYESYFLCQGNISIQVNKFWSKHPNLYDLIKIYLNNKVKFIQEIIYHYSYDATYNAFNWGTIKDITFCSSDCHNGGRQVVFVNFEYSTFVYKPRSLLADNLVKDFVQMLNLPEKYNLFFPDIYNFQDHGWHAFLDYTECLTKEDVQTFYRRSGSLLAILDTLNYCDGHFENILAYGAHPVPIDLETVFSAFGDLELGNRKDWERSVLYTGLVQIPPQNDSGMGYTAAFQSAPFGRLELLYPHVLHDKSIDIEIRYQWFVDQYNGSTPLLKGQPYTVHNFISEFIEGYRFVAYKIHNQKSLIYAQIDWWKKVSKCPVRQILRKTLFYQSLIRSKLIPNHNYQLKTQLQDNVYHMDDVVNQEIEDLSNLDIPYFLHFPNSKNLYTGNGKLLQSQCSGIALQEIENNITRGSEYIEQQVNLLQHILPLTPKP